MKTPNSKLSFMAVGAVNIASLLLYSGATLAAPTATPDPSAPAFHATAATSAGVQTANGAKTVSSEVSVSPTQRSMTPTRSHKALYSRNHHVPAQRSLDLTVGDVTQVFSVNEIRTALGINEVNLDAKTVGGEPVESMEVQASRPANEVELSPRVPFGFAGIAWAFQNPSQTWRLLTPINSSATAATL